MQPCDGHGPHARGERRLLPYGGDGNMLLCFYCYGREIARRQEEHEEQRPPRMPVHLPPWDSLKIHGATDALEIFLDVWCSGSMLFELGPHLTCQEANALAGLFRERGFDHEAETLLNGHALGDEDGDQLEHLQRQKLFQKGTFRAAG